MVDNGFDTEKIDLLIDTDVYSSIINGAVKKGEGLGFISIGQSLSCYWVILREKLLFWKLTERIALCFYLQWMILKQKFRTVQENKSSVYEKCNTEIMNV